MVVFAVCSHQHLPWIGLGVAGLLVAVGAIERSLRRTPGAAALLGVDGFRWKAARFTFVGLVAGVILGALYRLELELPLLPGGGWGAFVGLACLVGATEELVYRGWLQGRLQPWGAFAAVMAAAAAHAAYKSALFAWPPAPSAVNGVIVAGWTFVGGVIFGGLRQVSGSVLPAVAAHAAFDLLVYGAVVHAPWWVWG